MQVGIVGTGAMGTLLATQAIIAGVDCVTIERQLAPVSDRFLDITRTDQQSVGRLTVPLASTSDIRHLDVLIVPTKAYQVHDALVGLNDLLPTSTSIVLMHNGMGTHESVLKLRPENPLIAATTSYAALKSGPTNVSMTGKGHTHAGWLSSPNENIERDIRHLLDTLLPPCEWHQDVLLALWLKLAVNAVINPLTALHDVKNGHLCSAKYQGTVANLCRETSQVMGACGYKISAQKLVQSVAKVATLTAENYSSMHQDLVNQRPTEIDYINGYIVKVAARHHIEVPGHQALLDAVHQREVC